MLMPALRPNPGRKRVANGASIPAPVDGWDAISPVQTMDPKRAIVLDNWFPETGYVRLRKGYASHGTGMGSSTPINSILVYHGLSSSSDKMFSVAGTKIYDTTSAGAGSDVGVTLTSGGSKVQYVNYTTSAGTHYLLYCNGLDSLGSYDGSSWATPSITGITSADTVNLCVFKKYVWGILKDSMNAYYLPLDSVAGAATKFPLGSVMGDGGYLVAMATWTRDGGDGPDDYAVFVSSRGQVAVYSGSNPATDFALVGVYKIPPPIGYRCFTRLAGDLTILTKGGVIPMSKALTQDLSAEASIALTLRINDAINNYAQSYSGNFGWEFTTYPAAHMAILNIPVSLNTTAVQCVVNTLTGAWCRFTNWNFNCFAVFNDVLYAGGNSGVTYKAWTGAKDGTAQIDAIGQTAYNYFGKMGIDKRFTAVQPLITTDQDVVPAFGISTDFKDNATLGTPTAASTASAVYDTAIYDTDVYAVEGRAFADWTTISGFGQCAALHFRQSSLSASDVIVRFNGFNITYEVGEYY